MSADAPNNFLLTHPESPMDLEGDLGEIVDMDGAVGDGLNEGFDVGVMGDDAAKPWGARTRHGRGHS